MLRRSKDENGTMPDRETADPDYVQSFVRGLSTENNAIVQAIVDLAQATGLKVTAEGVETEEQSSFLSGIGCNELQGFLLSHPMSGEQIDKLLGIAGPKYAAA